MNPELIGQQAQVVNQVGLLNWMVPAVMIFSGALVGFVLHTNNKREERYINISEKKIEALDTSFKDLRQSLKENMTALLEANKYQRTEHESMIITLTKNTDALIALTTIIKVTPKTT